MLLKLSLTAKAKPTELFHFVQSLKIWIVNFTQAGRKNIAAYFQFFKFAEGESHLKTQKQ